MIYVVGMSYVVCLSYVKLTALAELRTAHAHAQSLFLAVKPVTPTLFISYMLELYIVANHPENGGTDPNLTPLSRYCPEIYQAEPQLQLIALLHEC